MTSRRLLALTLFLVPLAFAGGCSLVNSFGDVVPLTTENDSGPAIDTSVPDVAVTPPMEASADTGAGNNKDSAVPGMDSGVDSGVPIVDSGPDTADSAPLPPSGVLVVGGQASADGGFVLTTLDPTTGLELAPSLRENMTVVAVHYDGIRDLWYIFENTGIGALFPTPTDVVYLHVRTLDTHTGVWTELAKLKVPPIVSTDTVAVLRNRLVYTAYALNDAGMFANGYELVLVNTTTPAAPSLITPFTPLAGSPPGVIGTRNPSLTSGGTMNMLQIDHTSCEGDGAAELCSLDMVHVTVPGSGPPVVSGTPIAIGAVPATQGTEGFASFIGGGPEDVVGFPPANGASAFIQRFEPSTSAPVGSPVNFGIQSAFLKAMAVSECYSTVFVVAVPGDTSVYGIPLTGATTTILSRDLGHSAQGVRFEPYTSTVIAPFKANGSWALLAYTLSGPLASPSLTPRTASGWNPPADLEPNFVGVRQPIPFLSCPSP